MPYIRSNLISRRGYSGAGGLAGTLSDIGGALKDVAGGAVNFYGASQQAVGAAAASQATNRDLAAALAAKQGPGFGTILIGAAAVGGIAYFLLRKKKPATGA